MKILFLALRYPTNISSDLTGGLSLFSSLVSV